MTNQTFSRRFARAVRAFKDKTASLREIVIVNETDLTELATAWREVTHGTGEIENAYREMSRTDRDALEPYIIELHNTICERLTAKGGSCEESGILWTNSPIFKGGLFHLTPPDDVGGPRHLLGVYLEDVPSGHWIRGIFDTEDDYCQTNRGLGLILGSRVEALYGGHENRQFYVAERSRSLTAEIARHQRERERIAKQNEDRERRQAQREWENSPAGMRAKIAMLESKLATIETAKGGS